MSAWSYVTKKEDHQEEDPDTVSAIITQLQLPNLAKKKGKKKRGKERVKSMKAEIAPLTVIQSGFSDRPRFSSLICSTAFRISVLPILLAADKETQAAVFPSVAYQCCNLSASGKSGSIFNWVELIVLTDLPLNSVTRTLFKASTGFKPESHRDCSFWPSASQNFPHKVTSTLRPDMSFSWRVLFWASEPSFRVIVAEGQTDVTIPTKSTIELTSMFSISLIWWKLYCCLGMLLSSLGKTSIEVLKSAVMLHY